MPSRCRENFQLSHVILPHHTLPVTGGQSETAHTCADDGSLHFSGEINTNGGGFCSIRAPIPDGLPPSTQAIRLSFVGDGKTYKLLLSDGTRSTFGPSKRSPSWQADIPTSAGGNVEEITVPLSDLLPSWGGSPMSQPSPEEKKQSGFKAEEMKEIGVMLSLKLSDGSPNPEATFGKGVFPFSLRISLIEPVLSSGDKETK